MDWCLNRGRQGLMRLEGSTMGSCLTMGLLVLLKAPPSISQAL